MMLDSGGIDYATFLTAHLYMSRSVVDRLLLNMGDAESRKRMAHVLFDLRDAILPEVSADLRSVIVYLAVLHLSDYVINLSEIFASWAYTDSTYGGAAEDFKSKPVVRSDGSLTPKVRRRLYSPSWIRRYVKHGLEIGWIRYVRTRLDPHLDVVRDLSSVSAGIEQLQLHIERQQQLGEQSAMSAAKPARTRPFQDRQVLARSLRLARSILPAKVVQDFFAGKSVVFSGETMDLAIKLRESAFSIGHGTCYVSGYSKAGEILVDLCVYFEDTPAFDQLVGFALHMSSGLEHELLTSANMVRAYPAGVKHPLVRRMIQGQSRFRCDRRLLELEYFNDTNDLWGFTCLEFVFGSWRSAMLRKVLFPEGALPRRSLTDSRSAFPLV
jgi:hypothetical protein